MNTTSTGKPYPCLGITRRGFLLGAAAAGLPLGWLLYRREHSPFTGRSVEVPRPPYWGGFVLDVEAIELWVEGDFRIHDRARWTRDRRGAPQSAAAPIRWTATRLQP